MAEDKNNDFIAEIVAKMKAHEAPYKEGAWEAFAHKNAIHKPQRFLNWKYASAAAALLLAVGGYLLSLDSIRPIDGANKLAQQGASASVGTVNPVAAEISLDAEALPVEEPVSGNTEIFDLRKQESLLAELSPKAIPYAQQQLQAATAPVEEYTSAVDPAATGVTQPVAGENTKSRNFKDFAASMEQGPKVESSRHAAARKWELGAFVSPAQSTNSTSLGGGVSFVYHINKRVSLRSGLAVQNYSGNRVGSAPVTNQYASISASATDASALPVSKRSAERDLASVSAVIVSLEIPVDVQYKIGKGFFASAGVSYANILSQSRQNNYISNANGASLAQSFTHSSTVDIKDVPQLRTTEKTVENLESNQAFNGFANFSIGRKIPVGKKISLSVEPYIKLPVGSLKESDINYRNGGVRISTSF